MKSFTLRTSLLVALFSVTLSAMGTKKSEWVSGFPEAMDRLVAEKGKRSPSYNPQLPPVVTLDWDNTMILNDIGEATYYEITRKMGFSFDDSFWALIPQKDRPELQSAVAEARRLPLQRRVRSAPDRFWRKRMAALYEEICAREGAQVCYQWIVQVMAGLTPEQVKKFTQSALKYELAAPVGKESLSDSDTDQKPFEIHRGIRYYAPMKALAQRLKKEGFDVWVISASSQWSVEEAAKKVGIGSDRVIGMLAKRDAKGKIAPEIERMTYRQGKADAIQAIIGREPVFAAGDSPTDIEMLLTGSGPRLVLDRGKEELLKLARARGWWIQPLFLDPHTGKKRH